jgi:serine/threonine protein phosphatase PrpC
LNPHSFRNQILSSDGVTRKHLRNRRIGSKRAPRKSSRAVWIVSEFGLISRELGVLGLPHGKVDCFMGTGVRIRDVFDVTNRRTMLVIDQLPSGIVAPGDTVVYPMRGGGIRSARVLGVEFLDRRLSTDTPESWLALAVAPPKSIVAEPPFEATVHHSSAAHVPRFAFALMNRPSQDEGDDRIGVWQTDSSLTIALADGAGGVSGAATAAQSLLDSVDIGSTPALEVSKIISALDQRLASASGGQSTAVVLTLSADGVVGASVGDSGAWILHGDSIEDLTSQQNRKPLLGTGVCVPVGFSVGRLRGGTLLVASDGLLKYAKRADVVRVTQEADLDVAARALVQLVTLRSGKVPDDVSVVLCREVAAEPVRPSAGPPAP